MQQTSAGGAAEKGGLEFSLANLFKCMCFTHEDPDDSKKQLVNVIFRFYLFSSYLFIKVLELTDRPRFFDQARHQTTIASI